MLIIVRNGDINKALRELKRKVFREGILTDYRKHMAYESKSVKRRRKHKEHLNRVRKDRAMLEEME